MLSSQSMRVLGTIQAIDGDEVAHPAMKEGQKHPLPEDFEVKVHMFGAGCIEAWAL